MNSMHFYDQVSNKCRLGEMPREGYGATSSQNGAKYIKTGFESLIVPVCNDLLLGVLEYMQKNIHEKIVQILVLKHYLHFYTCFSTPKVS